MGQNYPKIKWFAGIAYQNLIQKDPTVPTQLNYNPE